MKEGWDIKRVKDIIIEIKDGGTPSRTKPEYFGGPVNWCVVKDILPEIYSTKETLTELGLSKCSAKIWPINSVIISLGATIGQVGIAKIPVATKQGISGIVLDETLLKPEFLVYFLNYKKEFIQASASGTTIKEIRPTKLAEILEIPVPPLPEQQRIVAVIDEAFEAIDKAIENTQKNIQNAKELFENYLQGEFDTGNWATKTIQELTKVVNGYAFASKDFKPTNTVRSIKITNVGVKEFVEEVDNYLPEKFKETLKDFHVKEGNIVIALTRTIIAAGLKVAVVPASYDGALVNQRVAALVPIEKLVDQNFLYYYLMTSGVAAYVLEHVNTLMQPNLSINDLKNMPVPFPSLIEQQKIVRKIDALQVKTQTLESKYQQKLRHLEELKKSVLNKAFAGEL